MRRNEVIPLIIQIVEDDKAIREELAELLRNSGYEAEYLTDFSASYILVTIPCF